MTCAGACGEDREVSCKDGGGVAAFAVANSADGFEEVDGLLREDGGVVAGVLATSAEVCGDEVEVSCDDDRVGAFVVVISPDCFGVLRAVICEGFGVDARSSLRGRLFGCLAAFTACVDSSSLLSSIVSVTTRLRF